MGEIRIVGPGKTRGYAYPVREGSNSYRMSARGVWIGMTSARGNVNSKRR